MALKQKATTKILYSMGEVCEMFDLPASTIRFWEKNFPQIKPKKNAKGNRLFTPEDIEVLKVVYHLVKEKGMTLSGADKYLNDSKVAARKETNVVEILQKIRASLVAIRTEINSYEKQQAGEIIIKNAPEVELEAEFIESVTVTTVVYDESTDTDLSDISTTEEENIVGADHDEMPKPRYYEPTLFDL